MNTIYVYITTTIGLWQRIIKFSTSHSEYNEWFLWITMIALNYYNYHWLLSLPWVKDCHGWVQLITWVTIKTMDEGVPWISTNDNKGESDNHGWRDAMDECPMATWLTMPWMSVSREHGWHCHGWVPMTTRVTTTASQGATGRMCSHPIFR